MSLLTATSICRSGRRRWSSRQQRYLHCLRTLTHYHRFSAAIRTVILVGLYKCTHTQPFNGFCPGLPGRPVPVETLTHSLTPILIIEHPLSSSSIYNDPWHPLCSFYMLDNPLGQPLSGPLWSSPWSWTLNFILHAFLHPIIIILSQHMLIPTQPVLLQYQCYVIYT